jgi:hypothetical protein
VEEICSLLLLPADLALRPEAEIDTVRSWDDADEFNLELLLFKRSQDERDRPL